MKKRLIEQLTKLQPLGEIREIRGTVGRCSLEQGY